MVRVRLKGINSVTKRLADGTLRTYWYAWKGGPSLRGEPGTPEFVHSYNEASARKAIPPSGTLLSILQAFQASEDFTGLADSTRRSYVSLIKRIEKEFSDFPLAALTDRRTRGVFMAWRDRVAAASGRRQADYAWDVLARVLSWSLDRGLVLANPCTRGGRLYRGSRRENVWTPADEAAFFERAPARLHLALMLALWTGQRQGDLLRLPWSAYDGKHIRLRQSKTGARVVIPVGAPLKAVLDAAPKVSPIILTNRSGKPWRSESFRWIWNRGLQGRWYRRAHIPRSARHGCHPTCACGRDRGRDRNDHRAFNAKRTRDPRHPLPSARSGARRERDHEARTANKTPN
jgi:integrase